MADTPEIRKFGATHLSFAFNMDRTILPHSTVRNLPVNTTADQPPPTIKPADSYQAQFLKLIPVEVLSAYITIEGLLRGSIVFESHPNLYAGLLWSVFVVLTILNPVYLYRVANVHNSTQVAFSTGAFIIYIMSLGGPFALLPYDEAIIRLIGSVLIPIYTLLALIFLNK